MDGFQFVEHLRQLPSFEAATVLMLSSLQSAEDIQRARELGLSSYLTKPVRRSALLSAITEALLGLKHLTAKRRCDRAGPRLSTR